MGTLVTLLVLGAIGACIYFVLDAQSGTDTATVQRSPSEVIAFAIAEIPRGTASLRSSWMPTGHTDRSATFLYKRRRSLLLAIVLFFCFIIPAVLYLVFGGKSQTLTVNVMPGESTATTVQVAASGGLTRRRGRRFLAALTAASPAGAM